MEKNCSSCKNGDKEFPDVAKYKLVKAPRECREIHGIYLCEDHMVVADADYGTEVIAERLI